MVLDPVSHYASTQLRAGIADAAVSACRSPIGSLFPLEKKIVRPQVTWDLLLGRRFRFSEGREEVKLEPRILCDNLPAPAGLCSESICMMGLCIFCSSFCTVDNAAFCGSRAHVDLILAAPCWCFQHGCMGCIADACPLPFALYEALTFHSVVESLGTISATLWPS